MTRRSHTWLGLTIALPCLALLAHAARYYPFFSDDAFISLRYAQRLIDGAGLTWTGGERVEGYSNLLWVLACALLGWLGVDLVVAARLLGLAATVAVFGALVRAFPVRDLRSCLPPLGAALALALSGPVAVWSIGGLEQPLLVALLAWAIALCLPQLARGVAPAREVREVREVVVPSVLLGLACWTRPDAPLFAVAFAAAFALRRSWRAAVVLAAIPLLFFSAQLAFRLWYYGDWVPNTAHVKLAFSSERMHQGLRYVGEGALGLAGLAIPALVASVAALGSAPMRARVLLPWCVCVPWCAYVVAIGGDIFPAHRHLAVLVVLLVFLAAELWSRLPPGPVAALAVVLPLGLLAWMQRTDEHNVMALDERWEWDGEVIGRLLDTAFAEQQPLVAVTAAGCIPYFSGLPSLDMLGLNDHYLATHRPEDTGGSYIGHEVGDGAYVLGRQPDLVIFCGIGGQERPCYRSGLEMYRDPAFHARYRVVECLGTLPYQVRAYIWVRRDSPRIGIQSREDEVVVPGYLLADGEGVARLDDRDRFGLQIARGGSAGVRGLRLAPGVWRFSVAASGAVLTTVVNAQTGDELGRGNGTGTFAVLGGSGSTVDLACAAAAETAHVRGIVLDRRP